jgi:S-adenosylmethionine-diacylglycerol 3-amino-3-carboxypropyl transferase
MSATAVLASGELRYSAVWEDHRLLERGLDAQAGSDLLVIASAGCNVLNLLRLAPRRIVAIDVNPAQTALVQLKLAALSVLDHDEFRRLIGAADGDDRLALYERVRPLLDQAARGWWDANTATLEAGAEGQGRLERFFADFRRTHVSGAAREAAERLLDARDPAEQHARAAELFTPEFEAGFLAHFTRESLGGRGRDPSLFRFVGDDDVPGWFLGRLFWACTALPAATNHYLARFLLGAPRADVVPPYQLRTNYERLRALAPRVEVVTERLDEYLGSASAGRPDGAGLSDVFEYLSPDDAGSLFAALGRTLRPGGRLAYWNLLVPRQSAGEVARLRHLGPLSHALWKQDRAWFYRSFNVEEAVA